MMMSIKGMTRSSSRREVKMLKYIAILSCVLLVAFVQGAAGRRSRGRGSSRQRVCEYSVDNGRYSVYDGQSMYERRDGQCLECSCSDGEIECELEDDEDNCRKGGSRSRSRSRTRTKSRGRDYSCVFEGERLEDGESVDVDCNVCRCRRGKVSCTRRLCPGQGDCRKRCRNAIRGPVCGPGAVTFPSRCVATCFGLNDSEIIDGPCSNRNPCLRFPCPEGSICIAHKPRCFFRKGNCQSIYQLRICVSLNVTKGPICDNFNDSDSDSDSDDDEEDEFTIPPTTIPPTTVPPTTAPPDIESPNPEGGILDEIPLGEGQFFIEGQRAGEPLLEGGSAGVCGTDGYSYNSTCEMAEETGEVDVAYKGKCDQDRCQYGLVCGSDGETYESVCELEREEGERFDYEGECEDDDYDSDDDSKSRSRSRGNSRSRSRGNSRSRSRDNTRSDDDDEEEEDEDGNVCERVRSRGRCRALGRCSNENVVQPSTGCCPICGGVLTAAIEEDFAGLLPAHLNNVGIVTAMIFRSRFINNTFGDIARRCFIRGYLTWRYDYEVILEAKDDEDGEFCFQVVRQLREIINNVTSSDLVMSDNPEDQPPVILSALTAATSGQSLAENQLPAGGGASDQLPAGGASSAWLSSPLLLISVVAAAACSYKLL